DAAYDRWPRQRRSLGTDLEVGGAVVDRDAAVGDVREPRLDAFGDVLAATDHEVGVAQPPFDHVSVELAQPLALHVQDELCRRGGPAQDWERLRVVEDMDDVEVALRDVRGDATPVAPQMKWRREKRVRG